MPRNGGDQLPARPRVIVDKDPEDRALVERCRRGDWEAYTELVVRYQKPIYNAAFWILRNTDDARDVTQTVFMKAAERLQDYDPKYRFFSWIYRIAVNEALNQLRDHSRDESLDEDFEATAPANSEPEWNAEAAELSQRIRATLMQMSTNDRLVLMLRHFGELSYEEIADTLDVDVKTVKSRLFDARQRLRDLLQDLRYH